MSHHINDAHFQLRGTLLRSNAPHLSSRTPPEEKGAMRRDLTLRTKGIQERAFVVTHRRRRDPDMHCRLWREHAVENIYKEAEKQFGRTRVGRKLATWSGQDIRGVQVSATYNFASRKIQKRNARLNGASSARPERNGHDNHFEQLTKRRANKGKQKGSAESQQPRVFDRG